MKFVHWDLNDLLKNLSHVQRSSTFSRSMNHSIWLVQFSDWICRSINCGIGWSTKFSKECNILKKSHNCSEITSIYCVLETYWADFTFLLFIAHNFKWSAWIMETCIFTSAIKILIHRILYVTYDYPVLSSTETRCGKRKWDNNWGRHRKRNTGFRLSRLFFHFVFLQGAHFRSKWLSWRKLFIPSRII